MQKTFASDKFYFRRCQYQTTQNQRYDVFITMTYKEFRSRESCFNRGTAPTFTWKVRGEPHRKSKW